LGGGGWGVGRGPQTPTPQSPIPNPQSPFLIQNWKKQIFLFLKIIKLKNNFKNGKFFEPKWKNRGRR